MTFICLICKEAVTSESDYQMTSFNKNDSNENIIIATKCGHLYHKACLKQFFSVLEVDDEENGRRKSPTLCPKCNRVVVLQNVIRIYPEDNEDDYYMLLKEKCDVDRENVKLKAQNEDLSNELRALKEGLRNNTNENKRPCTSIKTYSCILKEGDRIVTFKENSNESIEGIVQSIGYYNHNSLHANILFDDGDAKVVPVAGLILSKDFYGEDRTSASKNIDGIPIATDDDATRLHSHFDRRIQLFNAEFKKTKSTMNRLREDVDSFSSEQIDGVISFIESQKVKAVSLKRQLIALDSSIQKLITTQRDLVDMNETKRIEEKVDLEMEECIQFDSEKRKALEILGDTLKLYNIALPQVQKIKSFIKAGFIWLEILEADIKKLIQTKFSEHVRDEDLLNSIDKEMQSRRFLITTIQQAVKKFMDIPNSKLALMDHKLLVGIFSRFTVIEAEFEDWKASKNCINN